MSRLLCMLPLNKKEIEKAWRNIVYAPKQVDDNCLNLTLKSIHAFVDRGQIDFGGGEYLEAKHQKIEPELENDPKYGWWNLEKGNYLAQYNEILDKPMYLALVSPHERLLRTGTFHPTFMLLPTEKGKPVITTIQVGEFGIRVKENARISTAITFKLAK